jgi:NAD(P)-dependent dehydrogenase (short-subunit alcohol dehydrogenase family)
MERLGISFGRSAGMASSADLAALLSFLVSDEARNVNGAVVTSDGGWMAA